MATGKARVRPGSYPMLRIALLFSIGIVAGRNFTSGFSRASCSDHVIGQQAHQPLSLTGGMTETALWVFFSAILFFFLLLTLRRPRSLFNRFSGFFSSIIRYITNPLYLCILFLFGGLHSYRHSSPEQPQEHVLNVFEPDDLIFYGVVTSDRKTRSGNRLLRVSIDSVALHNLPQWYKPFPSEVFLRNPDNKDCSTGFYMTFSGDLSIPSRPGNPNQFDYAQFLARQGIQSQIFVTELFQCEKHPDVSFWIRHRVQMRNQLAALFSDPNSPLARAIILGDRSDLDPELRTSFSRAGLAHLMAVSGMHVGFILLPLWFLLPYFRRSTGSKTTALLLAGGLLLMYAGITGFSVSVSRASLMAFFMILARLFHKPGTSMNILGLAAFILLLRDPGLITDVGFQLSFLAVIIILTTLPGTRYLLPARHRYRKTGALFQFVMVSVLVQGGLYPVLVHYFHEFSIAGPISNTLAVPFVQFMFLWSFLCLALSMVSLDLAIWANMPGDLILSALSRYVDLVGKHPAAWIEITLSDSWIFGLWFFMTGFLASLRLPAVRTRMLFGILVFLTLQQAERTLDRYRAPLLTVTFFDVGQADAILLQTPGGKNYFYDTGVWTPRFDSAERVLIPELRAMGIRKLDGVILSHPHADHIGGMVSLMEAIPIDTIYQSPVPYDSRLYHRYMSLAREKDIPVRILTAGDHMGSDPSLLMLVLAPSDEIPATDPNNQSVVLLVIYGQTRFLLPGDAEAEAEAFLVERFDSFLRSDLLKVGHHASRTSSTKPFLDRVSAPEGVASLAWENRHNHPNTEATWRLNRAGTQTRFTSLEGAIRYNSDGHIFRYEPWR